MSTRKKKGKHWKKEEAERNENKILRLLSHKDMRFKDLSKEFDSPTTLTGHLKRLVNKKIISRYWNEDRKANYYRITPQSMIQVKTQLGKYEVIDFIESIPNPIYIFEEKDKVSMAIFSTAPENERAQWKQVYRNQISTQLKTWKEAMDALPRDDKRKLAMVITVDNTTAGDK